MVPPKFYIRWVPKKSTLLGRSWFNFFFLFHPYNILYWLMLYGMCWDTNVAASSNDCNRKLVSISCHVILWLSKSSFNQACIFRMETIMCDQSSSWNDEFVTFSYPRVWRTPCHWRIKLTQVNESVQSEKAREREEQIKYRSYRSPGMVFIGGKPEIPLGSKQLVPGVASSLSSCSGEILHLSCPLICYLCVRDYLRPLLRMIWPSCSKI